MTIASRPDTGGGWLYPTVVMLLVQTMTSVCILTPAILAPVAAADFGVSATSIGTFTAVVYFCAMTSGTLSGAWMRKLGPVQLASLAVLVAGIGLALISFGNVWLALAAAVFIGVMYGPVNPISAYTLNLVAPVRWRPLVFSIKQCGVVVGGTLAGALVPTLIEILDWKNAALVVAVIAGSTATLVWPLRRRFPTMEDKSGKSGLAAGRDSLQLVMRHPRLRLAAIGTAGYAGVQVSIAAFTVIFLTQDIGISLVTAGLVFAVSQVAAILGRLFWGAISGQLLSATMLLFVIAILSAIFIFALYLQRPGASVWALGVVCFCLGFTSFGWNGVFLAEVTAAVEPRQVSEAVGGTQFFFFGGVFVVPPAIGAAAGSFGFQIAFLILMLVAVASGFSVLRSGRVTTP